MFSTTFRGLAIEYDVSEYYPGQYYTSNGDPGDPPEGGECETWYIDRIVDVEEFIEHLREEIPRRWADRFAFGVLCWGLRYMDKLSPDRQFQILRRAIQPIKEAWAEDIEQHCTDHFWTDLAGEGCQDPWDD
jgi:hypothetical protein